MMDDQKILDNAPEGATHIEDNSNLYIKVLPRVTSTIFNDWFIFEIDQWIIIDTYNVLLMRSLADIKKLVELREANAEFKKDNAHLKKEVDKHRAGFVACMTGEQFTIHNLKQEAKGIELLIREETSVGRLHNGDKRSFIFCQDAKIRALELLGKAKSLKAGN
jgi:hypothetical protein